MIATLIIIALSFPGDLAYLMAESKAGFYINRLTAIDGRVSFKVIGRLTEASFVLYRKLGSLSKD